MRLRSNSVTSCLGLAVLVGGSFLAASLWDQSGDATAQEAGTSAPGQATQPQNAENGVPRDVREQPMAIVVPGEANAVPSDDGSAPSASIVNVDPSMLPEAAHAAPQENETVMVMVDHAKVVKLPDQTQTVIVGNPMIADITVQRNGIIVVTGKAYGATNLIALNSSGQLLAESIISVQAPSDAVVTVQRGLARESYSCTPTCQPSLRLGDASDYFGGVGNQTTQRNTLATQR